MNDRTPKPKQPSAPRSKRTRHSFREAIVEAIRRRVAKGEPLHIRKILEEAGGGSIDTVREELSRMGVEKVRPSTLVGAGASTPHSRIAALSHALDESIEREKNLAADNRALREALANARADLEKLLAQHYDTQKKLLQGVDDLRQMVRAGQGALPPGILAAERAKQNIVEPVGDAFFWKAKHDSLMGKYRSLEDQLAKAKDRLAELDPEMDE